LDEFLIKEKAAIAGISSLYSDDDLAALAQHCTDEEDAANAESSLNTQTFNGRIGGCCIMYRRGDALFMRISKK
jgi:hypothetical protein